MMSPIQKTIIEKITSLCEVSPDMRMGQLFANLGFLSEDFESQSLWNIEDEQFLGVIEIHLAQMTKRHAAIAEELERSRVGETFVTPNSAPALNP